MSLEYHLKALNKIKPRLEAHYEYIDEYIQIAKKAEEWVSTLPDLLIEEDNHNNYTLAGIYKGLNDNKEVGNKKDNFIDLFKDKRLYEQFDKKCKVLCGYIWGGYDHLTKTEQWLYHEQHSRPMEEKLGSLYDHSYYHSVHDNLESYVVDIRKTLEVVKKEGMEHFGNAVERVNKDSP